MLKIISADSRQVVHRAFDRSFYFPGKQFLLDALLDRGKNLFLHLKALGRDRALKILQFP
jgi:hypothetical protein